MFTFKKYIYTVALSVLIVSSPEKSAIASSKYTAAGTWTSEDAHFNSPRGLGFDKYGRLLVAASNWGNHNTSSNAYMYSFDSNGVGT